MLHSEICILFILNFLLIKLGNMGNTCTMGLFFL
jgi:hypothetical protein